MKNSDISGYIYNQFSAGSYLKYIVLTNMNAYRCNVAIKEYAGCGETRTLQRFINCKVSIDSNCDHLIVHTWNNKKDILEIVELDLNQYELIDNRSDFYELNIEQLVG